MMDCVQGTYGMSAPVASKIETQLPEKVLSLTFALNAKTIFQV